MPTTSGTTGTSAAASYGLDVSSIVSQLVAADRKGPDTQIARRKTDATTQISGLAAVKSALSVFQTAISKMKGTGALATRATTTSDEKIVTATATSGAATGTYNVEVLALAKSQQLSSTAFATGPTAVVGTGTLTIGQGTGSFTVTIDSTNNTLSGIRNAINSASGNTGVQATLIQETNGAHLVLSSTATGAASSMTVTQTGGDGGLAQIAYDPAHSITNLTEKQPAQDSHIKVAGYDRYSPTNSVSDSIDGLTLNLISASPGDVIAVGVSLDTADVKKQVQSFVSAYNSLQGTLSQLDSYDASTRTAGAMFGDSMLRGIEDQLRQDLSKAVTGLPNGVNSLAAIGVTKQIDGTLALDETKLNKAVAQNPGAVSSLFGGEDGVATTLFKHLDTMLLSTGSLASRNQSLQETLSKIQDDTDTLDARMGTLQKQYVKQFTALDSLLASLQTTSNYLTTALDGLPKPNLASK
ncbi:MAG: flagellar filament capping protein FliD [Gammaproteobacteria bacterium]